MGCDAYDVLANIIKTAPRFRNPSSVHCTAGLPAVPLTRVISSKPGIFHPHEDTSVGCDVQYW